MDADFLLIRRMKSGDEAAIESFVRKYYPMICNYCRCHTYGDGQAEDLTQETFERFFKSFGSYHHSGKLANYLYVIAGNLCRDSYKRKRDLLLGELPEPGENPLEERGERVYLDGAKYQMNMEEVERRMDMESAVRRLPEEMREVIILHYFQDLKLREVAQITGTGLPLVKYRLKRAKELLKAALEGGREDEY